MRLPCLFDRSIYPPHHPHNDFFSLSRSRDLRWRLNSTSLRHGFDLKWFRFRNSLLWSIFAPWRKHRATCPSYLFVSARSFLPYLNRIQLLRRGKIFIAFTCFAQSTIIAKPFSKVRVSHSDDTRFLATFVKISSTSVIIKSLRTLSASFSPLFLLVNKYC